MRKTVSLLFIVAGLSFAAPVITIVQSVGPGFGSPNLYDYTQNALTGLLFGTTNVNSFVGNGSGSAVYNRLVGAANVTQVIDTTGQFNSWLGLAPGAIAGEFGNRLYFGLIVKDTNPFSLSNLVYVDGFYASPTNIFFNTPADTYDGVTTIGINYGPNNVRGGGDDIIYQGGQANNLLVNEIYYSGYSNTFLLSPPAPGQTPQQQLNTTIQDQSAAIKPLPTPVVGAGVTTTPGNIATLVAPTTNQSVPVSGVPEPSTYALFASGLAALALARRRRS